MRQVIAVPGLCLALAVAGCGSGDAPTWDGPPRPLPADGALPVDAFGEYVNAVDEPWERSVVGIASAYALPLVRASGDLRASYPASDPEGGDTVVVTLGRLYDDSVRELRVVFTVEALEDGSYRIREARWDQRCHPGRGHEQWSPAACA